MQLTRQTQAPVRLTVHGLQTLGERVFVPSYRRAKLSTGVVHMGVGNFHRAHQATYFDQLAELGVTDWGITGVALRSRAVRDALAGQDNLFTVVERDGHTTTARVVGSMLACLHAPTESHRVLAALTSRQTQLVTLTLTGNGYPVDETGKLVSRTADVLHDLREPHNPQTAFGYLVEALALRKASHGEPLTVLSCDNLPHSGDITRAAVIALAQRRDPGLVDWIEGQVSFPNAMVDRITPATTDVQRRLVHDAFGIEDKSPVVTEGFSQWVVEDSFAGRRPPLESVGVQFVADVAPYKLMKTRLLNGSHCALGYLGTLAGHHSTGEAMADPLVRTHIRQLMAHEVAPLLPDLPGINIGHYQNTLLERFANSDIADPLSRLCGRGSTKMPSYLLPSLHEALHQQRPHGLLTLTVAAWMRYLRGTDLQGRAIELNDAQAPTLHDLAIAGGNDPRPLLSQTSIFGDLGQNLSFVRSLHSALAQLDQQGLRASLATCAIQDRTSTDVRSIWSGTHRRVVTGNQGVTGEKDGTGDEGLAVS